MYLLFFHCYVLQYPWRLGPFVRYWCDNLILTNSIAFFYTFWYHIYCNATPALLIANLLYDSAFLTLENKNIEIIKWSKLSFTPPYYFFLRCNISVNSTSFFLRATVSLRNVLGVVPLIFLKNLQKFCDEDRPILEAICSPSSSVKRR